MSQSKLLPCTVVWLRLDFRLADNLALDAAVARGRPVVPVFIWSPGEEAPWAPGAASNWWLHRSLQAMQESLLRKGSRLLLREGPTLRALEQLIQETGATAVYWNRRYEPVVRRRDEQVAARLQAAGVEVKTFNAALLHEPPSIQNKSGNPFQVFTPFWRHCRSLPEPSRPLPAPDRIPAPGHWPSSLPLEQFHLEPELDWAGGLRSRWQPGEDGAARQLHGFLEKAVAGYDENRNRPDLPGTSRLSPHLHFGELSPRQVWHALKARFESAGDAKGQRANVSSRAAQPAPVSWRDSQFLTEIGWREFAHHLLYHFPHTDEQPLRSEFARMRWRDDSAWRAAWRRGRTGYPIVDAAMRELWSIGWMHNRARMIVASFLVKDLRLSWQEGSRWFWDTLVDADLAQNTLGWQWTAGCGADAAPYFRIFNPVSQGQKFDPDGAYVRRWVPELAKLPADWIHQPHLAPPDILARAGVRLGRDYPEPLVSHAIARVEALAAYAKLKAA